MQRAVFHRQLHRFLHLGSGLEESVGTILFSHIEIMTTDHQCMPLHGLTDREVVYLPMPREPQLGG